MAFGDIGGPVTELVITCRTESEGVVNIKKGDALALVDDYTVANNQYWHRVFGEAMASATTNGVAIPVRVKGVCRFRKCPTNSMLVGESISMFPGAGDKAGMVLSNAPGNGKGIVLAVSEAGDSCDVLL
jgi:hypothetical protein